MMCDINGKLGSCCSEAVGDASPDGENANGAAFHALAIQQSLWVPSTFVGCTDSSLPQHTFQATNGICKRIDFIAVDQIMPVEGCRALVELSLDMAAKRVDHLPIAVSCWIAAKASQHRKLGRAPACCDRGLLEDPARIAAFQQALKRIHDPQFASVD